MIRGTTPTLIFDLPFEARELEAAYITASQDGVVKFEKELSECNCIGNTLTVKLSQSDTLSLSSDLPASLQIKAKNANQDVIASQIIVVDVDQILKGEEI